MSLWLVVAMLVGEIDREVIGLRDFEPGLVV